MSSLGRTFDGVVRRLPVRSRDRHEGYALCANDGFWFRPAYTDGKCPLCGKLAPGGAPPPPLSRRLDRSMLGVVGLVVESLAMLTLVLFMWFR